MKTSTFSFVTNTRTYSRIRLFRRAAALAALVACNLWEPFPDGALSLLQWDVWLWLAGLLFLREATRLVISGAAAKRDAAAFAPKLRKFFPLSPVIRVRDFRDLLRTGNLSANLGSGSRLTLTLSKPARLRGMKFGYTVTARSQFGDFGLAEFDVIMRDLAFNAPVAAALTAVQAEEADNPPDPPETGSPGGERGPVPKTFKKQEAFWSNFWQDITSTSSTPGTGKRVKGRTSSAGSKGGTSSDSLSNTSSGTVRKDRV